MAAILGATQTSQNSSSNSSSSTTATSGSPANVLGGILGKVSSGGGCKSGTTIPFMVEGTTSDPKFVPDVGGLAAGMLKSQLGCIGSTANNASGNSNANGNAASGQQNPVDAITGLFGKKKKQ